MSASNQAAESIADSMTRDAGVEALRETRVPSVGVRYYQTNAGALRVRAEWRGGALFTGWTLGDNPTTPKRARELIAQRIDSLGGTPHPSGFVTRGAALLPVSDTFGEAEAREQFARDIFGGDASDDCESVTGQSWETLTRESQRMGEENRGDDQ